MVKQFAVKYFSYDSLINNGRLFSHEYPETWEKEKELFCPGCGKKEVWRIDDDCEELYICVACEKTFYLPGGICPASGDQDVQRLKNLQVSTIEEFAETNDLVLSVSARCDMLLVMGTIQMKL